MKREVNLFRTRKPRNVIMDMALTLKDLGYSTAQIREILTGNKTEPKADPNCEACCGEGTVTDIVDYGSTTTQMQSVCECVK